MPEIAGAQAWLVRHPELVARLRAGIHMDMVGGLLATRRTWSPQPSSARWWRPRRAMRSTAAFSDGARDGSLAVREAVAQAVEMRLAAQVPRAAPAADADRRVPVGSAEIRGPLGVYYYDHLEEHTGGGGADVTSAAADGELVAYEALNLADGTRSIGEIRDVLTGRYGPLAAGELSAWFDRLARAGVVSFR